MKNFVIAMLATSVLVFSCKDDNDDIEKEVELIEIATASENGLTATIYAEQDLLVGYNAITVELTDETLSLEGETVTMAPLMDMMTMTHACPIEYLSSAVEDGQVELAVVPIMPSGDMGTWSITFTVAEKSVTVPVTVTQPEYSRLVSFTSDVDGVSYYLTLVDLTEPEVGQNSIELAVYRKETLMSWPVVDDLTFEMEPTMPSMGHGSPNNVAPAFTADGHYKGTVNFTMTGDWNIALTMMSGEDVLGDPYFDLYFQ